MKKHILFKLFAIILLASTLTGTKAGAQIAYSENFNSSAGGWSVGTGVYVNENFYRFSSAQLSCTSMNTGVIYGSAGSYASSGVWQYYGSTVVSPLIGNTLGGAISLSFICSRTGVANVLLEMSYGPSPSGPWTTITTAYPPSGGSCLQVTVPPFTVAEPGPLYLKMAVSRYYGTNPQEGYSGAIYVDSIVVSEAALPVCSGTPTGGTTVSSLPTVCSGPAFSLTVSPSPNQTGLTYQWEKSTDGMTWTNISGATTKYISAINQTASTYYRRKITCAGSGLSTWSSSLLVAQATSPFACYCASSADAPQYADVTNVAVGTLSNAAPDGSLSGNQFTATGSAGKYSNWTASGVNVPDLPRAVTIPFSIGLHSYSPGNTWTKVYVDFNRDGDLDDAGEMVYSGATYVYFGTALSGSMTIPANAVLGNTLMRVVCNNTSTAADVSPCGIYAFGETEDYRVNIVPTTNCGGTPATPVASGPAVVCDFNQAFSLNATNVPASGVTAISYQWQKSAPGANSWTAIAGATTVPYTVAGQSSATDYRLVVTCSASGQLSYSNILAVGMGASSACYCASVITSASACQRWISSVTTTGAVTNMTNTSTCTPGGFADYATSVTGPAQYQDYPLNLSLTSANSRTAWSIYVDYNNDAAFTNDELVYQNSNTTGGNTVAASFLVPLNATPGTHRMRIRADSGGTAATACTATVSGETEDYTLTVLQKPACTGTPASITISTTQPYIYCGPFPAKPMTLTGGTNTGTGGVTGIITTWERANDSSFSNSISPASSVIGQNQSGFYRAKQTCATSGQSSYSNAILVANHTPSVTISSVTTAVCAGSGGVVLTANVNSGIGSSPALSYSWYAGGSPACNNCISCTSCSSVTVNPTASANFAVNVTASGNSCPGTSYANRNVSVNPTPTVLSAVAPASACSGQAITLTGVTDTPGTYSGFAGPFVPAKWDFSQMTSNGKIITSGAPHSVVFISSDSTALSPTGGSDDWSITIPYAGDVTFNWTYSTNDSAGNDFVRYLINGVTPTNLPGFSNSGPNTQSGTASIPVSAGTFFTFRGRSRTNTGGSSTTTISNFSAPGGTASTVAWYTAPTGGTLIPNGASVTPTGTGPVTYYAQAVATGTGCVSASRMATNPVTLNPAGQWTGKVSADWNTAGNWCGGIPTLTSNLVIPGAVTLPNMPVLSTTGSANNIELQSGASLTVAATGTLNLYGNTTGTGTLNSPAGTVNLTGSGMQMLSPDFATGTLTVSGGSTKMLTGNIAVGSALNFTSGMIDVGNNTLTLGAGAVVTGASTTKYVRTGVGGRLTRPVGSTPVLFPVGNANYTPATLTNTGTLDNFSVGVRDSVFQNGVSGPLSNPLTALFVNHTWNVEEEVAGESDATLSLQWNAGEESNSGFDYNHVYVAHYTGGTYTSDPSYSTPGSTPAATGYPGSGPYTATRNNITSFSPFTVVSGAGGTPLPAKLIAFEAVNAGRQNKITWQTASEEAIKSYVLERSIDGAQFREVSETAAQNKAWTYLAYDSMPNTNFTYYRLKMMGENGTSEYSRTVRVSLKADGEIRMTAQPNPVVDLLTVKIYGRDNGAVNLTDISGRVLITTPVKDGIAQMDMSTLSAGTYFARYRNGVVSKTITVTKQ